MTSSKKTDQRRPPVEQRFKPGQSGNPAGRPKGSRNKVTRGSLARIVFEEATREAAAFSGVSAHRAVVRKLFEQAAAGDLASANVVLSIATDAEALVAALDNATEMREAEAAATARKAAAKAEDEALAAEVAATDCDLYRYARALAGSTRCSQLRFAEVLEEARMRIALGLTIHEKVDPTLLAVAYAEHMKEQT